MPKMKTHSGSKKRFSLTKNGKVRFKSTKTRHILTKKTPKVKRQRRAVQIMNEVDAKTVRKLLRGG